MKRLAALLLCVTVLLGTTACSFSVTVNETGGTTTTTTLPTSFEEFKTQWADTVTTTVHEDGSVGVGVTTTTEAAVPTVSTTEDPIPTTTTKPIFVRPTKPTDGKVTMIIIPTTTYKPAPIPTMRRTTTTRVTTTTTARPTTVPTTTRRQTVVTVGGQTTATTTRTTTTTTRVPTTTTTTRPAPSYTTGQTHTPLPYTGRYYYNILDDEWKARYRKIDTALRNLEEKVEFDINIAEDRNYLIVRLYLLDTPELFYVASSGTVYNHGDGTSSYGFNYAVGNGEGEFCGYGQALPAINDALRQKIRQKEATFQAEVNRIVSTIPANVPAVEKERLIYDRILRDSHYNTGAHWDGLAEDNWTAYGIMVNKYGVCESYSEAFQTLCYAVGINCTGVIGSAGGGHKWNAVQLDGEWYQCDITFDDPVGNAPEDTYHYYFNITDAEMAERDHIWGEGSGYDDFPTPKCNGTKYSYTNYFGGSLW